MAERAFRVVWQAPDRAFSRVAWLRIDRDSGQLRYRFGYEPSASLPTSFQPFLAFPDLSRVWESDQMFPFFANRVLSPRAPGYAEYIAELGLEAEATPIELLAGTLGRRQTDTVQVIPAPVVREGLARQRFLTSGVRHVAADHRPDVSEAIARLAPGDVLHLRDDPGNEYDPRAVLVDDDGGPVGWVPGHMLEELHKAREINHRAVRCIVVHANGPSAPWHLRLLCDLERPALDTDETPLTAGL